VNILCYIMFYHCGCNVTYILLVCWFSLVLCVVLNVSCNWLFYIVGRVCVLTGVHFLRVFNIGLSVSRFVLCYFY
jgi:hypothetical protein